MQFFEIQKKLSEYSVTYIGKDLSENLTPINNIKDIEKSQKQLYPTDLGKVVNKLLVENFPDVINVEFTAKMEEEFDEIAEGTMKWKNVIKDFYGPFSIIVEQTKTSALPW